MGWAIRRFGNVMTSIPRGDSRDGPAGMVVPQRENGSGRAAIFHFVMVKPTHYDDDGYPIQWFRSAIPSNTLACLNGLAEDARRRSILGPGVEIPPAHLRRDQSARCTRRTSSACCRSRAGAS